MSISHRHLNCLVPHQFGPYTFITTSEKPRELVIAEDIRRLTQQDDLTCASIRYQQMIAETQVANRPIRVGRYPVLK